MEGTVLEITDYESAHQPWFERLNRNWIEEFFWMESIDYEVLQHPEVHIIEEGGSILMAIANGEVVGTVALKYVEPDIFEFTKMAVDTRFRGMKIGETLALKAIERARKCDAAKIILYSNTVLAPAIALYRKLGFREVPLDGPYERSNIKMELML
jgi:ribosomal protein S18 acetylase RimI-like enzyme